ncbi:uncharacterized protein LOC131158130 [Malania oleifera]|uniref:uncharacterized protein LOC131158130 n=1 Tax=Malania oleifera TaxID=397392 RepID=UPI0025AE7168|nr:uncharacterized protein LOC131158130 [Malania oleifera]
MKKALLLAWLFFIICSKRAVSHYSACEGSTLTPNSTGCIEEKHLLKNLSYKVAELQRGRLDGKQEEVGMDGMNHLKEVQRGKTVNGGSDVVHSRPRRSGAPSPLLDATHLVFGLLLVLTLFFF